MRYRLVLCMVMAVVVAAAPALAAGQAMSMGSSSAMHGGKMAGMPMMSGQISVLIDNRPQHYSPPPMMMNGSVMVPMRGIFESLGAKVTWDSKTEQVTAMRGRTEVLLKVGDRNATVNGKRMTLESAPHMYQNAVFVPLRFVSESLGANVKWDASAHRVMIATAGMPSHLAAMRPRPSASRHMASAPRGDAVVDVSLVDGKITLKPTTVKAGAIEFAVRNDGTYTHALAIVGMTQKTRDLSPGGKAALTVTLKPGTYTLYCPVDNHRAMGMETKLKVE